MIKILSGGEEHPLHIDDDSWYITHKYDGLDELEFEIDSKTLVDKKIEEETEIEADGQRYLVKNIDDREGIAVVTAIINLDDWKRELYTDYRRTNVTTYDVVNEIAPDGWTVAMDTEASKRGTIEESEGEALDCVVPLDILTYVASAFGATFAFDTKTKTVHVINPDSFENSGEFFMEDLNLRSVGYTGNSSSFATRLYAYGKKDEETGAALTFADINDGKPYVEDFTYSDKIVSVGWSDERYTVAENLLEAAKEKLNQIAKPERSYECDVINLKKDMWLYKKVILVDKTRKQRVEHKCVEYKEYPRRHDLDVCTLSTLAPDITRSISGISGQISDAVSSGAAKTETKYSAAIKAATELISGATGGHYAVLKSDDGRPYATVWMDTDDINTAKNLIIANQNGIGFSQNGLAGPFSMAMTIDGTFDANLINVVNLNANSIVAGILRDQTGKNSWDLENGVLNTQSGYLGFFAISGNSLKNTKKAAGFESLDFGVEICSNLYKNMGIGVVDGVSHQTESIETPIALEFYCDKREIASIESGWGISGEAMSIKVPGSAYMENAVTIKNDKSVIVSGNLSCYGSKNRAVETTDYSTRLMYAYETASPLFGDIGEGEIGDDGTCTVWLDPTFVQTVADAEYQVFLSGYSKDNFCCSERNRPYFKVEGTPGTRFAWEVKCKQSGYQNARLERMDMSSSAIGADYAALAESHIAKIKNERMA